MERILVFIPVFNCEKQIRRVLENFNSNVEDVINEILIIDNQSLDDTVKASIDAMKKITSIKMTLIQNSVNCNLGGSHKVAFNYALEHGFDYVIVLHGDDQGDIRDIINHIRLKKHIDMDCLLGARFMLGSKLRNYSWFRTIGNIIFNIFFSVICKRMIYDLGSGLNLYKVSFLKDRFYLRFPNALTFNYYMLLYTVAMHGKFIFFPLTWKEDDQISNVKLFKQTKQLFAVLYKFCINKKNFLFCLHEKAQEYEYCVIFCNKKEYSIA